MEADKAKELKEISYSSFDELYNNIDEKGSLGLLALGYKGLLLWRKKKVELSNSEKPSEELNEEK